VEILWKPYAPSALARRALDAVERSGRTFERDATQEAHKPDSSDAAAGGGQALAESSEAQGRVLLVDDDHGCRRAFDAILDTQRIECIHAASGADAVALLESQSFDAALVEVQLPDTSGFDLLTRLRAREPLLPVVMMSDSPSLESMQRALQLRATSFLAKPVAPDDLVASVRHAVQDGQVRRVQQRLMVLKATTAETFSDLRATEQRLSESLAGLYMVFQPIVRSDGAIFGFEALLRTCGPYRNPLEFLSVAEALGRLEELGRAARRAISEVLAMHPERREPIFVNIHPSEFRAEHLGRDDEPLLPWASRIILEVTERAQLGSATEVADTLRLLRNKGFRFALDDLGEGYAGLSWLVKLAPDVTKIDMSLIRGIESDPLKRDAVASLVNICRRARAFVVAEGVETAEEARTLRDLGCELLQGYYFARPGAPFPEVLQVT
jgi:EAL domain-containing protein (putative c-di-GMP-specific phosphodiesterase class I)